MAPASKRAKTTATLVDSAQADANGARASANPQLIFRFQTGPSLERVSDDVLHEILSHLPALRDSDVLFGHNLNPPVIPSSSLIRTPTLRALSQTSRLLRSRCLAMAWQCVELCGARIPEHITTFYRATGDATKAAIRVLNACPHLWPLIETVTVVLTRFQSAKLIPGFAACLVNLPNLTNIQVVHAHSQMTTAIKKGFQDKWFPSVRRVSLPCSAHEIIKSCPNVEEVICVDGDGSTIVGSIINGKCLQVHTLKGCSPKVLKRLVKPLPNLKCVSVRMGWCSDMTLFASFLRLDTIEINILVRDVRQGPRPSEYAASDVKRASEILKESKSKAQKTVIVTKWETIWERGLDADSSVDMIREVIRIRV